MRNAGEFISFVQKLRRKKGFTMRQLCNGLCSVATMEAMTDGKWKPDQQLQDRILERLGVAEEDYMHMLDYEAYARWEMSQHILHSITFGEAEQAEKLLEGYGERYCKSNRLEEQFYLAMYAQVRYLQGCSGEALSATFKEALEKTVPESGLGQLEKSALSVKELNLLLETERCREGAERWERYQEVVDYIERSGLDGVARVKIYPKTIYYLCKCAVRESKMATLEDMLLLLQYCEQGIELLREYERMYFLWELLEIAGQLVCRITEELRYKGQQMRAMALEEQYQEKMEWKQALEAIYAEYGVSKETKDYCYLYVMKGVYCINDVICIRREMLGMSRKELCHGICDVKTLQRLEQGVTKPHKEIAKELLQRLGLPGEFTRTELVTGNPEARRLMQQLRDQSNLRCWDKVEALRERIRGMVPMDILCNQQVMMNEELLPKWRRGQMDNNEYCTQMRKVLELTLPYEAFLKEGKKYFTNEELTCIVNRIHGMDSTSEEYLACMCRLEEFYEPYIAAGLWEAVWNMYEFVMSNVGSARGNSGEYDKADSYDSIILEGCLRFRRMGMIHTSIYARWWNHDMQKSEGIPTDKVLDDEEELSKCILFSVMAKDKLREQFYRQKLETIK